MRLSASETDNYGWKKFASSETTTDPYITFTYNRKPNAASAPVLVAPQSFQFTPVSGTTSWFTTADRPTFTSTATDPDGASVQTTVTYTVVNLQPVAQDDAASVGEDDASVTGNVIADPMTGDHDTAPEIRDLFLTGSGGRTEHYEIAAYGSARAHAHVLGHTELVDLLQTTLDEEGEANKHLTQLAEGRMSFVGANDKALA